MTINHVAEHVPGAIAHERPRKTIPIWGWLVLGSLVTILAGMRFNVGILGWVASVPWLIYLRRTSGWKSRLLFFGVLQLAMFVSILKIITSPIPWLFAPMYSVPMALSSFILYIAFEWLRRKLGDGWGLILFPSMIATFEWATSAGSPMGSWGAAAYTQIDNLALMQNTAIFGLTGVSALLAVVSALVTVLIDGRRAQFRRATLLIASLVMLAHAWGSFRVHTRIDGPMVTVATIVTDVLLQPGQLPNDTELARANDALFARSKRAAEHGAQLIVWNEGATAVNKSGEAAFLARGQQIAANHNVDIVMAYVVPLESLKHFENKYVWMTPQGPIETYLKHHPVPGEGAVVGTAPLVVHQRPYGRAAGAICYDYDFPGLGKDHAAAGADIVVVPSSDWPGIDPYHTQMAAVRGIEGGFSVVRPVRAATSGAYDAHGTARGTASDLDGQYVMLAAVPAKRINTIYSRIGDVLPIGGILIIIAAVAALFRRRHITRRHITEELSREQ